MVDSIRRTVPIGVVKPSGPLRPLERRDQSRQDSRNTGNQQSETSSEERNDATVDRDGGRAVNRCPDPPDEEEAQTVKPGRCIDVRI